MAKTPENLPKQGALRDTVSIWDERKLEFVPAWEARFKRQRTVSFFDAKTFKDTNAQTSESFFCAPYQNGLMMIFMPDTIGSPTDMLIELEFSDDNVNWYKYMRDFWGDLRWEDTGAPYSESFEFPCLAQYVRIKATSAGATDSAYFTLTAKIILNG